MSDVNSVLKCKIWSYGEKLNSVDSTESRENKKKSSGKMLHHWEVNPGPLTFTLELIESTGG